MNKRKYIDNKEIFELLFVIKSLPSDEEIKNEDRNINGMLTEKESEIWRDGARYLREMVRKLGNV